MIDPLQFGVSFSAKQCRNFGLDPLETLEWLIGQGFRRFRLMTYWNDTEPTASELLFDELDSQLEIIRRAGGEVTLCLGVKQPRWPEYHWPEWALKLTAPERRQAVLDHVGQTVERYKNEPLIVSWQLENEALLKGFGEDIAIDRLRLRAEYKLVKRLGAGKPIIMSTSNGWGIPIRRPWADIVGFSYYGVMHQNGAYHKTIHRPWLYKLRKLLILQPVFIHELQCEPWGPKAIWEMPLEEQFKSMSADFISKMIADARSIGAPPIDLWGGEWWCWLAKKHHDSSAIDAVKLACQA